MLMSNRLLWTHDPHTHSPIIENISLLMKKLMAICTHEIVGTCTVKYTIADDNGQLYHTMCHDAIHVISLHVRLVSP